MWNHHQVLAIHYLVQDPLRETCIPLWVNSALGRLKYFVNIGSAYFASYTVLISALSTPVDDVAAKRTLNLPHLGLQLIVAHATAYFDLVPWIELVAPPAKRCGAAQYFGQRKKRRQRIPERKDYTIIVKTC